MIRTAMKSVLVAVEAKDNEAAQAALNMANSKLDKSVSKGIHHKNFAIRQKSNLAKAVISMNTQKN